MYDLICSKQWSFEKMLSCINLSFCYLFIKDLFLLLLFLCTCVYVSECGTGVSLWATGAGVRGPCEQLEI